MISKVEKIQSVGVYDQYQAHGDVSFNMFTYIYAENGAGKTTLSSILRSLSYSDVQPILKRQRIDSASPIEIELKESLSNSPLIFRNNSWNRNLDNIEVFDTFFVNENVYAGFDFTSDQRKKLYRFAIGNDGVKIAKLITRIKNRLAEINASKTAQGQLISALTEGLLPIDDFCNLTKDPDIDLKIQNKNHELLTARNQDSIRTHASFEQIQEINLSLNYDEIKSILKQSINGIGQQYISIVEQHLQKLNDCGLMDASMWIQKGYLLKNEGNCPFCNQPTSHLELIKGYNQYFNEQYTSLSSSLNRLANVINDFNIALLISQLEDKLKGLSDNYAFWHTYIPEMLPLNEIQIKADTFVSMVDALKKSIASKQTNCTLSISDEPVVALQEYVEKLNEAIRLLNTQLLDFNAKITTLKQSLRSVGDIEKELKILNLQKKRFEQDVIDKCNKYRYLCRFSERLNTLSARKREEQQQISQSILSSYGNAINHYLRDIFGTKFTIEGTRNGGYRGRSNEPTLDYTLKFNGHNISTNTEEVNSVKYTLSEGDKNSIAFSFFLAKIHANPTELLNKIIVFDDPLSSLDLNRRNRTIEEIVSLRNRCAQVIVLSHNLHFLIDLNNKKSVKASEKKSLRIAYDASHACSSIVEYQIKQEWIDKYHSAINAMTTYLANPSEDLKEDAINGIRISLETFLKLKFCQYINHPDETFGKIISELKSSACSFINQDKDNVIQRLESLCEMSWRTHHGSVEERETYAEVSVTENELQTQYIPDTLNLINKEL